MEANYYSILGTTQDATSKEIKKAYKRLAMKHHPDRNAENKKEAEEKFKKIQKAYSVLSDPEKRQIYDQYGEDGVNSQSNFGGNPFAGGFGGFEDLFGQFFSGHSGQQQASDYQYNLDLSFEDAVNGSTVKIRIPSTSECGDCNGTGAKKGTSPTKCFDCDGNGEIHTQQGFFSVSRTCSSCHGAGSIIKHKCGSCHGAGSTQKDKSISVKIPAGVDTGNRIKVSGEGEYIDSTMPKGDLYILVNVIEHDAFNRNGYDILCDVPIAMGIAILGGTVEIPILNGSKLLNIPEGVQTGDIIKLAGDGVPHINSNEKGDFICRIIVETPINLNTQQKALVREFSKSLNNKHKPDAETFLGKIKSFF